MRTGLFVIAAVSVLQGGGDIKVITRGNIFLGDEFYVADGYPGGVVWGQIIGGAQSNISIASAVPEINGGKVVVSRSTGQILSGEFVQGSVSSGTITLGDVRFGSGLLSITSNRLVSVQHIRGAADSDVRISTGADFLFTNVETGSISVTAAGDIMYGGIAAPEGILLVAGRRITPYFPPLRYRICRHQLTSIQGNIGANANDRFVSSAWKITANALSGSVYLENTADLVTLIGDNHAGGSFDLTSLVRSIHRNYAWSPLMATSARAHPPDLPPTNPLCLLMLLMAMFSSKAQKLQALRFRATITPAEHLTFSLMDQRRLPTYLRTLDQSKSPLPLDCCKPHPAATSPPAKTMSQYGIKACSRQIDCS